MELTREQLFTDDELNIEAVAQMIQSNPARTKEILEFIADEMKNEEEFKEKLDELKHEYHHKKKALYKEYWFIFDED